MYARYPHIKQVGLCHSVQGTAEELARDLDLDPADLRYRCAGINHMAFYLSLEKKLADGSYVSIYPDLLQAYADGRAPKPNLHGNPRCENIVRYEMLKKLGYFVTESSEHFAEYTPWFIKPGRDDLLARYKVPLDEYPKRCVEQLANWHQELESYKRGERIGVKPSREYASTIMNAIWTGEPSVVYGNVRNDNLIDNLPQGCCVEVACLGGRQRHPADQSGRAAGASGGADADQYQRADAAHAGDPHRKSRLRLLRHDDGSAHRRGAGDRRDLRAGGRSDRQPRRLAAGPGCTVNPLMPPGATNPAVPVTLYQTLKEALATATGPYEYFNDNKAQLRIWCLW